MVTPLVHSLGDKRAFIYFFSPSRREVGCDTGDSGASLVVLAVTTTTH